MPRGETNLGVILKTLEPQLKEPTYVFISVPVDQFSIAIKKLCPVSIVFEEEGVSLIVIKENATAWLLSVWESGMGLLCLGDLVFCYQNCSDLT